MFLRLMIEAGTPSGQPSRIYVNSEPDGTLRMEEYIDGQDPDRIDTKCVYGRTLTPAQATELKDYLASQGY